MLASWQLLNIFHSRSVIRVHWPGIAGFTLAKDRLNVPLPTARRPSLGTLSLNSSLKKCRTNDSRRTTLTRHQNHHSGTIEESQARTQGQLLTGPANQGPRGQSVTSAYDSNPSSGHSTPSPNTRTESMSPSAEMASHYQQQQDFYRSAGSITSHPVNHSGPLMPITISPRDHASSWVCSPNPAGACPVHGSTRGVF